ncbi:MAG: type III-B CRISPR module RAMP protein Cmr6 [Chromatiaceae bacterium]|nr:type III-B CRISPR module RAMP protein Cmr6 [Chromatiaceae bacterium]
MTLPLYRDHQAPAGLPVGAHRGLWYERFFNAYDDDWTVPAEGKSRWVTQSAGPAGEREALDQAAQRQLALVTALGGRGAVFHAEWHFATGLGLPHPVENGLAWHHTLGVPYLAGSAVKGLVRAWVEVWDASLDDEARQRRLDHWFGTLAEAGAFCFFDALPIEPVSLHADVMTPHMGKWYEQGGEISDVARDWERLPADWHAPVPVPFLVARKPRLLFGIAPRRADDATALDEVFQALKAALEWLGAGAKTAVGYGQMHEEANSTKELLGKQQAQAEQAALAQLPPEQQRLRRLRQQLEQHRERNIKPEAGGPLMQEARALLNEGLSWPAPERAELATLLKQLYDQAGWGSGEKKRERKGLIERLRG